MSRQRFTCDGSDALEQHLSKTCERVADGIRKLLPSETFTGLLLGGGYGRGEGGVLRTCSGDKPYNDLEFYVFIRGALLLAERRWRGALHELGESLSPEAGLEVEFKLMTNAKLRRSEPTMFYYDLVMGNRRVVGDESLLAGCEHHRDAAKIPLHEAARLLMNRCSGLLYAAERLSRKTFGAEEADFVGRNIAKAQLALGDVLLTARGQYHWSCRERHRRLESLAFENAAWREPMLRHHAAGMEFKLHPIRSEATRDALAAQHAELKELARSLWLWLESRRLGTAFGSVREYAEHPAAKCPETSPLKNLLVTARAFGLSSVSTQYPRERLLRTLPVLLWEPPPEDFGGAVAKYAELWNRFN